MGWTESRRNKLGLAGLLLLAGLVSCSISYKFNGASIDYTLVKSISISDFPNMAPLVYPPLAQRFTDELKDKYIRQTRLQVLRENGTLDLDGEITGYELTPQAVKEDAYASMTRLTISVRVRYSNQTNPDEDFEQSFSAYREFSNTNTIDQVQDDLCAEIVKELIDLIYNATVATW
ncbi:MAG: LPS assembly lipoprotein LptE [Tannerella sp.]|jgi:hypothetical protein|nr:LPS assembly lipoprotein LptE [Tannerella sp.]